MPSFINIIIIKLINHEMVMCNSFFLLHVYDITII